MFWKDGHPKTVREVKAALDNKRPRAYTTVMTLMNVMVVKALLKTDATARPFVYSAVARREKTKAHLLRDLWVRVFGESAGALVEGLLKETKPNRDELDRINRAIDRYTHTKEGFQCQFSNSSHNPSSTE